MHHGQDILEMVMKALSLIKVKEAISLVKPTLKGMLQAKT